MNVPEKLNAEDLGMTAEDGITALYWQQQKIIEYFKAEEEINEQIHETFFHELRLDECQQ